jgi:SAM-dependent methyltransferase
MIRHSFADLGKSPLCETFLDESQIGMMEPFFPLHAVVCDSCWLVQVGEFLPVEKIFSDQYPYFSSYSTSWLAHAKRYCEMVTKKYALDAGKFVVEIASNDGYLLRNFAELGVTNVLGVEPASNVASVARENGIPVLVDFFGTSVAERIRQDHGPADLIIGNNVLAHVPDLVDFISGVKRLLKPGGVATFEFPHLERLVSGNQFDTIYHEHFCYYSATTINILAERHGFTFSDVEELPTHGGSLRIYLVHSGDRDQSRAVRDLLAREESAGLKSPGYYSGFAAQVQATKRNLLGFLIEAKNANLSIAGYGAAGKGNTLLNYCGIGPDFLDFIVDRNQHKHGRYTPGTHIPILPVDAIDRVKPDYILILPWNLRDEIVDQMSSIRDWGGKFVVPIPTLEIVDPREVR